MPNMARSNPSGKGGDSRWWLTKCASATGIASARPGNASVRDGRGVAFFDHICQYSYRVVINRVDICLHVPTNLTFTRWHRFRLPRAVRLDCSFSDSEAQ